MENRTIGTAYTPDSSVAGCQSTTKPEEMPFTQRPAFVVKRFVYFFKGSTTVSANMAMETEATKNLQRMLTNSRELRRVKKNKQRKKIIATIKQ